MPVIAMVRQYSVVGIGKRTHYGHLADFLPDACMSGARQKAFTEQIEQQFFRTADEMPECVYGCRIVRYQWFSVSVAEKMRLHCGCVRCRELGMHDHRCSHVTLANRLCRSRSRVARQASPPTVIKCSIAFICLVHVVGIRELRIG
jgi:hypothetical protein